MPISYNLNAIVWIVLPLLFVTNFNRARGEHKKHRGRTSS